MWSICKQFGPFYDNLVNLLGRFQNFSCLQKRENVNNVNFAETPLSLYLLICDYILISHLKDSYYLLASVSDPVNVDNSVGFQ